MCATCHCYVISAADGALPAPKQDEADTVEFNAHEPQENSRLTCQIIVTEALEGAVFQVATGR
jgi:2Fe-2S ferredoxin